MRTDRERKAREKKELEKMRYSKEGARRGGGEAGQRSKQGGERKREKGDEKRESKLERMSVVSRETKQK